MFTGSIDERYYIEQMNQLKKMVHLFYSVKYSPTYNSGLRVERYLSLLHGNVLKNIYKFIKNKIDYKIFDRKKASVKKNTEINIAPNYFSKERISVYTCVFGDYDSIYEPITQPNNIDYYVITDKPEVKSKTWKVYNIQQFEPILVGMTNVEKNRWFKMHPVEVFGGQYRYSIYIDGNILPVTDFTEYINKIGDAGIAMFSHRYNDCIYQEALNNIYLIKKTATEEINKQILYLKENGMPEQFGMTTCNVIARDHYNTNCNCLMTDWWDEFYRKCSRDQLSFPYVVWKNGFKMSDIARLGYDVWNVDSLLVMSHK